MILSTKLQKAINFSIKVHELDSQQKRKGTSVPYITHPLTIGIILSRVTDDEDIVVAGILHDVIEDCEPYGSVTYDQVGELFGEKVAKMVNDVTEQDKSLPWEKRKQLALDHISEMENNSILVKSADVLHNLADLVLDLENKGVAVFEKFNANQEKTLERYQKLLKELKAVWPDNPLLPDLEQQYGRLLELVKE